MSAEEFNPLAKLDGCDCPICRSYDDEDRDQQTVFPSTDESLPSDAEIDAILDKLFEEPRPVPNFTLVDAPVDFEGIFNKIFSGGEYFGVAHVIPGDSEDPRDYPIGPMSFKVEEVDLIKRALRSYGSGLADNAMAVVNADDVLDTLSVEAEAYVMALVAKAADESEKTLELYNWFSAL